MDLNNVEDMRRLDSSQVIRTLELLGEQAKQATKEAGQNDFYPSGFENVVICGMGGSNLGGRLIQSALSGRLSVPVLISADYELPSFVGPKTLAVISSYSGTTEESLAALSDARRRKARIAVITSNNDSALKKEMEKNAYPGYVFDPRHNPSGQPRLGLGYSVFGLIAMLKQAGVLDLPGSRIEEAIRHLEGCQAAFGLSVETQANPAKQMSDFIYGGIPVLVGAEHLAGNLHIIRNQINECSKNFSVYLVAPELNHYAMEGLVKPDSNPKNLRFVFFDSDKYLPRNRKRLELSKKVVKKNKIDYIDLGVSPVNRFSQSLEVLALGGWLSFYLGALNDVDPVSIPFVDWFKKELK